MTPAPLAVFDAYGTLFDVGAAARAAAAEPGGARIAEIWPRLSELWRRKQLEYTWLRAIGGAHVDFWTVTCDALDWALEACAVDDPALTERLRALYRTLAPFPEARAALQALRAAGWRTAILSNGAPDMLAAAVASAGFAPLLDAVISVEEAGVYKPDPRVYALVGRHFGVAPAEALFASSNGWDVAGAAAFGFRTVWINRAGDPVDRLPGRPAHILRDLSGLPDLRP